MNARKALANGLQEKIMNEDVEQAFKEVKMWEYIFGDGIQEWNVENVSGYQIPEKIMVGHVGRCFIRTNHGL